jgi:Outer membrane receptor proteins, mostly Fe transport
MKKIIFMFIVSLIVAATSMAAENNGEIFGQLKVRSSKASIEYATVSIYTTSGNKMLSGTVTDSLGMFHLENIPFRDNCYLLCSYIGLKDVKLHLTMTKEKKSIDMGTIWMDENSEQLAEVVVSGRRPVFVPKLDKKVFNVGQDIMSSSGSVGDLMQNIPSVEVDMDGGVSLRGNSNVTILINGKPSTMMSSKVRSNTLQQLPASTIDRIEIITNPSAQYKPDGSGGIINIVTKKDVKAGFNSSVTVNTGSHDRYNAGINMNYTVGKVNVFGGYAFRQDRYDRSTYDIRQSTTNYIDQTTLGVGRPVSHLFRLGAGINLSAKDYIEVNGSYNHRKFLRNENIESVTEDLNHSQTDYYHRHRDADAKENMWEGNFIYTHNYGNGNEWGINYTYSSESEDEMNRYSTIHAATTQPLLDNIHVWDANYLHIVKLHEQYNLSETCKLSAGYELEALKAEQSYHSQDWDGTNFVTNATESSDFRHYRTMHSVYATLEKTFGKWSLMWGLRGEYALISNKLLSLDSTMTQHYINIYPTIHASYKLNASHDLQLSYSLRVNRPEGEDMNPFAERINPLSLSTGNPNLKPEKIHSLEATWLWHNNKNSSLMTTLYYRYLTNQITSVSRYISNGVLLTTKENLESSYNSGIEMIWDYSVGRWMSFNWNVNGYYDQINAQKLGYGSHKDTFSWSTLLNTNFMPFSHYMLQINTSYHSKTLVPQGYRNADFRVNLGMKYDIPSINLSILASVTDLFDTYRKAYTLDTPELKQKVNTRRNPRIFYIGASYTFGSKANKHNTKLEYDENL